MTDLKRNALGPGSRAPPGYGGSGAPRGQPLQASATPPPYPAEPRGHDPGQNSRDLREPSEPSPPSPGRIHARPARFLGRETSPLASHTRGIGGDRWLQQAEA